MEKYENENEYLKQKALIVIYKKLNDLRRSTNVQIRLTYFLKDKDCKRTEKKSSDDS